MVGGTSMGAIIAACVAMGWDDEEIENRIRKAFVETNPLGDYVMPVVALSAGKRVSERLEEHFGSVLIEDLRTPFFAVSTNLMSGKSHVHRSGRLRDALPLLESIRTTDPERPEADRLRADIQRQLLALGPLPVARVSPPAAEGLLP